MADDLNGKPAWFIALEITVPAGLGMAVVPWQAGDFASTSLAVALLQTGGIVLMFTAVFESFNQVVMPIARALLYSPLRADMLMSEREDGHACMSPMPE